MRYTKQLPYLRAFISKANQHRGFWLRLSRNITTATSRILPIPKIGNSTMPPIIETLMMLTERITEDVRGLERTRFAML